MQLIFYAILAIQRVVISFLGQQHSARTELGWVTASSATVIKLIGSEWHHANAPFFVNGAHSILMGDCRNPSGTQ